MLSDVGMRRANNQDSLAAVLEQGEADQRGSLFIVADGMGAHAAGELASKLAVENIPHDYRKLQEEPIPTALRNAVQKANRLIHSKGQSSAEFRGMGTTCSSLVLVGDAALLAHVGDSRVYRVRDDQLEQLTFDHSLVWEMAEASHTTEDQVPACIPKNVITRSLGPHPVVNVDLEGPFELRSGDTFLMCSDGLTGVVSDQLIGAVMRAMPPADAAQTLVDLANLHGGPDNISIIVVRVGQPKAKKQESAASRPTDPIRWLALAASAACLALVVWCIVEQNTWGAVAGAIGLGAAVVRVVTKTNQPCEDCLDTLGGPYGSAPYRQFDCGPGDKTTRALSEVIDELSTLRSRVAEQNGASRINWEEFDADCRRAAESDDWREAVRRRAPRSGG